MVYRTKPDKGWAWVVLASAFCANVIHGFFGYAIGILNLAFLERFNEDVGKTSWASGIFLGLLSLTGPLAGMVINRWSCRVAMMLGSILMTSGFVISAFVDKLDFVFISFSIVSGLGFGLLYTPSIVVIGFNFERHRNFASGFASSGCGIGAFALTPLMQMTRDKYGYSGFCFMCGALTLHYFLFGALCRPSHLELKGKQLQTIRKRKDENKSVVKRILDYLRVLKEIAFSCMFLSQMSFCLGCYLMYVHFPSLAMQQGTSEKYSSLLLSVAGICNGISRLLVGMACNADNINELLFYSGCFSLLGIAGILFPFYSKSFGGQLIFAIILGTYSGSCFVLLNSITVKLVGIRELAIAFGLEMFGAGLGTVIGPPSAGIIVDAGGTYSQSFVLAGCTVLIGGLFGWSVACFDNGRASGIDVIRVEENIHEEEGYSSKCENRHYQTSMEEDKFPL